MRLARAAFVVAALCAGARAYARDEANGCREFTVPQGARLLYVASDMAVNGLPMSIKEMRTKDSPDAVLAFYRREWGGRRPGFFENPLQEWRTIATYDGPCYYTVQVRAQGSGTYALLGVSKRPNVAPRPRGEGFPMPSGSQVFNDLSHRDGPKHGRTLLLTNTQAPDANVLFYRQTFEAEGWVPLVDRLVVTDKGPAQVMLWRRGLEEASITVQKGGAGTTVVANLVDQP
jgi:hypothetical protein